LKGDAFQGIEKVKKEEFLRQICQQFQMEGALLEIVPYGKGHIHSTFAAAYQQSDGSYQRILLQHINRGIFPEPEKIIDNILLVTEHLRREIHAAGGDPLRNTITLIAAQDGKYFYKDDKGEYWRAEIFIEDTHTVPAVKDPVQYFNAGRTFGQFQKYLVDFPVQKLHVVIPHFHDTGERFEQFAEAVAQDPFHRSSAVKSEIDFAFQRAGEVDRLVDMASAGKLPERVTHNDAKLDNILMDDRTGEGVCVIDLDTVMPGLAVYDFGDIVRSGANTGEEDELDLSRVAFDISVYEQILHGFLDAASNSLTPTEIDQLPFAAKLITFEQGLRFLTDHLKGDEYYRVSRPSQNMERCRTQFKLVSEMERKFDSMLKILGRHR
jgi:hypothetical protein